jgi:hypothetical protein
MEGGWAMEEVAISMALGVAVIGAVFYHAKKGSYFSLVVFFSIPTPQVGT